MTTMLAIACYWRWCFSCKKLDSVGDVLI